MFEYSASDPDFAPVIKQKRKKKSVPLTIRQKTKRFLMFILVLIVFYLMLCSYILLNPADAVFFNNIFELEYVVIEFALEYTIYVFFGIIGFALLFFFLFFFYRGLSIRTRDAKRRWIVRGIAVIFFALFFGNLATFANVYNHFQSINFENLEWRIIVYDNSIFKYLEEDEKEIAKIDISKSLIGPVVLRFDLSSYMIGAELREWLSLSQPYKFYIDYEWDEEYDFPTGEVDLTIPAKETSSAKIIMRVDQPGNYQPVGRIDGEDVAGNPISIEVPFPKIRVDHIVDVTPFEQSAGWYRYKFDGGGLRDIGVLQWSIANKDTDRHQWYIYSPDYIFTENNVICLEIFEWNAPTNNRCDWRYVTEDAEPFNIISSLISRTDPIDRFKYQFELEDLEFKTGGLKDITWYISDLEYVGGYASGTKQILDFRFKYGGNHVVKAVVEDTTGRERTFEILVKIANYVPLKDGFTVDIIDDSGANLAEETYDTKTDTYIIQDVPVPHKLELDGSKVRANSNRLRLKDVLWDLDNDGEFELSQSKIDYELPVPGRYEIRTKYIFEDINVSGEIEELTRIERISIIGVEKDLDVRVRMERDGLYAPSRVTLDASGSKSLSDEIVKFVYDFGDGADETFEWEWVINYQYDEPGEYTVTVTAVTNKGERSSKTFDIIVKKNQEVARINTSIASGRIQAGKAVTLDARGSLGDIEKISWDLWDYTKRTGNQIIHIYKKPGTYTVKLSIKYISGIIEEAESTLIVVQ